MSKQKLKKLAFSQGNTTFSSRVKSEAEGDAQCSGDGKDGENSGHGNGDQSYPVKEHAPVKTASDKIKNGKRFWLKLRAHKDRGKRSKGNTMVPGQGCS